MMPKSTSPTTIATFDEAVDVLLYRMIITEPIVGVHGTSRYATYRLYVSLYRHFPNNPPSFLPSHLCCRISLFQLFQPFLQGFL